MAAKRGLLDTVVPVLVRCGHISSQRLVRGAQDDEVDGYSFQFLVEPEFSTALFSSK